MSNLLNKVFRALEWNGKKGLQLEELEVAARDEKVAKTFLNVCDQNKNGAIDTVAEFTRGIQTGGYSATSPLNLRIVDDRQVTLRGSGSFSMKRFAPGSAGYTIFWEGSRVGVQKGYAYRELDPTDKLHVNMDAQRHYRIAKTRDMGERELQELVKTATSEESWIYVKGSTHDGHPIEYWYENGLRESPGAVSPEHAVLNDVLNQLNVEQISFYHIHPGIVGDRSEFPSANDFEGAVSDVFALLPRIKNQFEYDSRIITPKGKVILKPNLKLLRTYDRAQWADLPMQCSLDFFAMLNPDVSPKTFIPSLTKRYIEVSCDPHE